MSQFESLGVCSELIQAAEDMGWLLPTDVQDEAIPLILGGGDVMIAAPTGSGKTGAFSLPLLQIVCETLRGRAALDEKSDDAIGGPADKVVLNMLDRDPVVAITPDGLKCQTRAERDWAGCRANRGVFKGKYFYEATVTDEGLCRVGWATNAASYNLGTDTESFGYGGTGMKSHGKNFEKYGEAFALNDTIGCFVDREKQTVSYSKNGKPLGVAHLIPKHLAASPLFPAVVLKNAEITFNFGETPFKFPPPQDFKAVQAAPKADYVLFSRPKQQGNKKRDLSRSTLGLIIEPTKELARQVADEIEKFKQHLDPPITHGCFFGGLNFGEMTAQLKAGVNIVVGTPQLLNNFIRQGVLDLSECRFFVLDEADELIKEGDKEILPIYQALPSERGLQVIVCSATLHSEEITKLAEKITVHPTWVDLKGKDAVPETVDHAVILVDPKADKSWDQPPAGYAADHVHDKDRVSTRIDSAESRSEAIKRLKPQVLLKVIDEFKMGQALIFCRTQVDCDNLEEFLVQAGGGRRFNGKMESGKESPYSCTVLHAGRGLQGREQALEAFREGYVKFLLCTDVAARGIDISELPYVINMTLPDMPQQYIHRIGRVGRADAIGLAISIVGCEPEKVWWHTCNRQDRGRGCRNTDSKDNGGCTMWHSETKYLKEIETLCGQPINVLDSKNLVKGREQFMQRAATGRLKEDPAAEASDKHVALLRPAVQELAKLEVDAQSSFLNIRYGSRWKDMLKRK